MREVEVGTLSTAGQPPSGEPILVTPHKMLLRRFQEIKKGPSHDLIEIPPIIYEEDDGEHVVITRKIHVPQSQDPNKS